MNAVIEVVDLVKTYPTANAVDGISFTVEEGEVVAILGPNGAGKSTTVEILEGHRTRTSGTVSVLGTDPAHGDRAFRDRIGIVLQAAGIDPELTVREVIDMYGGAYSRRRPADDLLALVELVDKADDRIMSLSGGQQRRVDLALGLVGDPELIFLDEPTTGFDPSARRRSWALVENLTRLGRTVVLTTHYLDEAEHLADRVLVLAEGRVVAEGTPQALRDEADQGTIIRFAVPASDAPLAGLLDPITGHSTGRGRHIEISTHAPTADLAHVTGWALHHGIELEGLQVSTATLEEVYLGLVGAGEHGEETP